MGVSAPMLSMGSCFLLWVCAEGDAYSVNTHRLRHTHTHTHAGVHTKIKAYPHNCPFTEASVFFCVCKWDLALGPALKCFSSSVHLDPLPFSLAGILGNF